MMDPCIKTWFGRVCGCVAEVATPDLPARQSRIVLSLVSEAGVSIGNQRLRTFLAILGIVIGVGSVVLLIGIGTASQHRVERTISALGSNVLVVMAKGVGSHRRYGFDTTDIDAIAELSSAESVAYSSFPVQQMAFSNSLNVQTQLIGTIPDYLLMRNWVLEDGTVFTPDDVRHGKRVIVIGNSLARQLFGDTNPLGRFLAVGEPRIRFQIVGILEPKGSGFNGEDQDNVAFLPTSTFKSLFGNPYQGSMNIIYVKARSSDALDSLTEAIRNLFRLRDKIPGTQPDQISIQNVNAVLQVASETTKAFSMLLTAIASISLFVGGIGIMNIMLVTVSERTREIGIRKALGATEQQIMIQFLLEAVMISGAGSLLGLVLGLLGGLAAEHWFSIAMEFNLWPVALALGMAVVIGLPSGIYPAYRAARMQAIDALRGIGG